MNLRRREIAEREGKDYSELKFKIERLKDRLNERENELADFKLRLYRALESLLEIYNADVFQDDVYSQKEMQAVYDRGARILREENKFKDMYKEQNE